MSTGRTPGGTRSEKSNGTGRAARRKTPIEAARLCARIADQKKASDILLLKVREIFSIADYFVICTCESKPQAKAIAGEIETRLKKEGFSHLGTEGREDGSWVLLDYGTVVVHVFLPETRDYYQIEMLWGDAPKVAWKRSRRK
jgi:ribosome-associated protein